MWVAVGESSARVIRLERGDWTMKLGMIAVVSVVLGGLSVGCGSSDNAAPPAGPGEEAEIVSAGFPGTYRAVTSDDDQFFSNVVVSKEGEKLFLTLDGEKHALS